MKKEYKRLFFNIAYIPAVDILYGSKESEYNWVGEDDMQLSFGE